LRRRWCILVLLGSWSRSNKPSYTCSVMIIDDEARSNINLSPDLIYAKEIIYINRDVSLILVWMQLSSVVLKCVGPVLLYQNHPEVLSINDLV